MNFRTIVCYIYNVISSGTYVAIVCQQWHLCGSAVCSCVNLRHIIDVCIMYLYVVGMILIYCNFIMHVFLPMGYVLHVVYTINDYSNAFH